MWDFSECVIVIVIVIVIVTLHRSITLVSSTRSCNKRSYNSGQRFFITQFMKKKKKTSGEAHARNKGQGQNCEKRKVQTHVVLCGTRARALSGTMASRVHGHGIAAVYERQIRLRPGSSASKEEAKKERVETESVPLKIKRGHQTLPLYRSYFSAVGIVFFAPYTEDFSAIRAPSIWTQKSILKSVT